MPRTDFFGKQWRTGEDLALDSTIEALGGVKQMANYWAQYSDKIKEEERKKREEQEKEEAKQLEQQEKIQEEFFQLKSLRPDLPDEVALHIAQMPKGPYRSDLVSNIKKTPDIFDYNPLRPATSLEKLTNFYNQFGSLEPISRMREIITKGAEQTGRSPIDVTNAAVEQGLIDQGHAELLYDSFGQQGNQEGWGGYLGRKALETPARVGTAAVESVANVPSVIGDIGLGATRALLSSSLGAQFDPTGELRESFTPEEYERMKQAYESQSPEQRAQSLQDTAITAPYLDIKQGVRTFFPNAFPEAKTSGEKMYNDALDTTGGLLMGGVRGATMAAKGLRALGAGVAGEIGKWGAQKAGAHPLLAEGIKLGSIATALFVGKKEAQQISQKIYDFVKGNPQSEAGLVPPRQTNSFLNEVNEQVKSGRFTPDAKTKNLLASLENKTIGTAEGWSEFNRSLFKDINLQENRLARQQLQQPLVRLIDALESSGKKDIPMIKGLINEINTNWNKLVYEGVFNPSQETAQIFGTIRRSQQLSLNDLVNLEQTLNNFYPKADQRDIAAIKNLKKGPLKNMFNYIENMGGTNAELVKEVDKAKQLFASSQEVGKVTKAIDKIIGKRSITPYSLVGVFGGKFTPFAKAVILAQGGRAAIKTGEQILRNLGNPTMRNIWGNAIKNALAGKITQSAQDIKKIINQQQDKRLNKLLKKK